MVILKTFKRKKYYDNIDNVMKDGEWRTADAVLQEVKKTYRNVPNVSGFSQYMAHSKRYESKEVMMPREKTVSDKEYSVSQYRMLGPFITLFQEYEPIMNLGINRRMMRRHLEGALDRAEGRL